MKINSGFSELTLAELRASTCTASLHSTGGWVAAGPLFNPITPIGAVFCSRKGARGDTVTLQLVVLGAGTAMHSPWDTGMARVGKAPKFLPPSS
jgi:hypothetical protein